MEKTLRPFFAKATAAQPDDLKAALGSYEGAMFPRSQLAAADAHETPVLCLNERVPQSRRLLYRRGKS